MNKGQSIVEVVFAVGITIMALSGVIMLIVNSLGAKNKVFDRKVAVGMGQVVVENLVAGSLNDIENFWQLQNVSDQKLAGFPDDYLYDVTYDSSRLSCTKCTEATVTIRWVRAVGNSMVLTRFFNR